MNSSHVFFFLFLFMERLAMATQPLILFGKEARACPLVSYLGIATIWAGCCTRKVTKLLLFGTSGRARSTNEPHRTALSRRSQPQFWGRGRPRLEDHAEHAVIFVGDTGGKVQPAVSEEQSPQTIEV